MQEPLNQGDRALLRGQDTPYVCREARAKHQLSLLRVTRCSARRFCKENCAAQEMEVWNLPEPHLSSLPSPIPPDRTTPFSAPLLPKGLGPEHTWGLCGCTTQSLCELRTLTGLLGTTKDSGLVVPTPNHHLPLPSQSAASISLPLLTGGSFLREKFSETR